MKKIKFKKGKDIVEVDSTNDLAIAKLTLKGYTRV